jgi:hypothetical protein
MIADTDFLPLISIALAMSQSLYDLLFILIKCFM